MAVTTQQDSIDERAQRLLQRRQAAIRRKGTTLGSRSDAGSVAGSVAASITAPRRLEQNPSTPPAPPPPPPPQRKPGHRPDRDDESHVFLRGLALGLGLPGRVLARVLGLVSAIPGISSLLGIVAGILIALGAMWCLWHFYLLPLLFRAPWPLSWLPWLLQGAQGPVATAPTPQQPSPLPSLALAETRSPSTLTPTPTPTPIMSRLLYGESAATDLNISPADDGADELLRLIGNHLNPDKMPPGDFSRWRQGPCGGRDHDSDYSDTELDESNELDGFDAEAYGRLSMTSAACHVSRHTWQGWLQHVQDCLGDLYQANAAFESLAVDTFHHHVLVLQGAIMAVPLSRMVADNQDNNDDDDDDDDAAESHPNRPPALAWLPTLPAWPCGTFFFSWWPEALCGCPTAADTDAAKRGLATLRRRLVRFTNLVDQARDLRFSLIREHDGTLQKMGVYVRDALCWAHGGLEAAVLTAESQHLQRSPTVPPPAARHLRRAATNLAPVCDLAKLNLAMSEARRLGLARQADMLAKVTGELVLLDELYSRLLDECALPCRPTTTSPPGPGPGSSADLAERAAQCRQGIADAEIGLLVLVQRVLDGSRHSATVSAGHGNI